MNEVRRSAAEDNCELPEIDKKSEECAAGTAISGQTNLLEAAKAAGITWADLAAQLGIPRDVDSHERLGRLRKQYCFSIHQVRQIICRHAPD